MSDQTFRDREILTDAQERGYGATFGAYLRLSGPGWLQSAITLGGGSLASALYLGMIGGTGMLWVQLVAILIGVVMLSAISYVTLSSGERPYAAMNKHINPVLGTAWIIATIVANMVFILSQFSLCFDALQTTLLDDLKDTENNRLIVSSIIGAVALVIVLMSYKPGAASRLFDVILKLIVGFVVLCFVAAVVVLFQKNAIDWPAIGNGFIPTWESLQSLSPQLAPLTEGLDSADYWTGEINRSRQISLVAAAAAAVGINMTFLLPYSMLARGWDRTFRGLARWDLMTGMAIPFVLVTSCIVITSANAFHSKADENILSSKPAEVQDSPFFEKLSSPIRKRIATLEDSDAAGDLAKIEAMPTNAKEKGLREQQKAAKDKAMTALLADYISEMPENERKLALATVKPNSKLLALSLEPLLGDYSSPVFGLGALAMGFSTIVVLMLINGYAFAEISGRYESLTVRSFGAIIALAAGMSWIYLPAESKTYLLIVAGTIAAVLLPIAYFAFFLMMNNRDLLDDDKPRGLWMVIWNLLMAIGVAGALANAYISVSGKLSPAFKESISSGTGLSGDLSDGLILGALATFVLLVLIGFSARSHKVRST